MIIDERSLQFNTTISRSIYLKLPLDTVDSFERCGWSYVMRSSTLGHYRHHASTAWDSVRVLQKKQHRQIHTTTIIQPDIRSEILLHTFTFSTCDLPLLSKRLKERKCVLYKIRWGYSFDKVIRKRLFKLPLSIRSGQAHKNSRYCNTEHRNRRYRNTKPKGVTQTHNRYLIYHSTAYSRL